MMSQRIQLLDRNDRCVATAEVDQDGPLVTGVVDLHGTPAHLRSVFERLETMVNDQVFSLVDAVEGEIAELGMTARFGDGHAFPLCDLQVFPAAGHLSFRLPSKVPQQPVAP